MDYCDDFISCLDSHSDGTHSLRALIFIICINAGSTIVNQIIFILIYFFVQTPRINVRFDLMQPS